MAKANKTQPTNNSVAEFIDNIHDEKRKSDSSELVKILSEATGSEAVLWGSSIVGFGKNHYKYETGREGDTMAVGFAPRKQALVIYGILNYDLNLDLIKKLGPHTNGKGCIYIKDLSVIDKNVLKQLVRDAYERKNNADN